MTSYTGKELKEILDKHRRWLYNHDGTKECANLRDANLINLNGNLIHIKSLQTERYYITYTSKVIQIGCKRYTIDEWKNFEDEKIRHMDIGALEWWSKWKPIIMQIIELAPCEETKS